MEKLKPGSAGKNWPPLSKNQRRIALPPDFPIGHPWVVYFVRNGNRVKIGYTKSIRSRVAQFGLTWHQIALLLDGGAQLEGSVHTHFTGQRVEGTEWFRLEPPLFAFIKHYRSQPAMATLGSPKHERMWSGRIGWPRIPPSGPVWTTPAGSASSSAE